MYQIGVVRHRESNEIKASDHAETFGALAAVESVFRDPYG